MTLQQPEQINTLQMKGKVGEEVVWRRDVTKGFFRKKSISAFLITNYRIIDPTGKTLYYEEIDDVVPAGRRMEKVGNYYSTGVRNGSISSGIGNAKGTYVSIGDIHFMSSVKHDIIWHEISDVDGMVKLVLSLKKQGAMQKQIQRQKELKDKELLK